VGGHASDDAYPDASDFSRKFFETAEAGSDIPRKFHPFAVFASGIVSAGESTLLRPTGTSPYPGPIPVDRM
jgi:hypothetical protein